MVSNTPVSDVEDVVETPEDEQPSPEEMFDRIQAEFANRPPAPKRFTIAELFQQSVALVASATGRRFRNGTPTVSETAAVKLYELSLMWALNNRGETPSHDILPPEDEGEFGEELEAPVPDETIEASADQTDPEE